MGRVKLRKNRRLIDRKQITIPSHVKVHRTGSLIASGHEPFRACVRIGSSRKSVEAGKGLACAGGKNPRAAVAAAMRKLAAKLSKRKGAFRGAR